MVDKSGTPRTPSSALQLLFIFSRLYYIKWISLAPLGTQNTDHLQFHSTIFHLHNLRLLIIQILVFLHLEGQQIWQVTSKLAVPFLGL